MEKAIYYKENKHTKEKSASNKADQFISYEKILQNQTEIINLLKTKEKPKMSYSDKRFKKPCFKENFCQFPNRWFDEKNQLGLLDSSIKLIEKYYKEHENFIIYTKNVLKLVLNKNGKIAKKDEKAIRTCINHSRNFTKKGLYELEKEGWLEFHDGGKTIKIVREKMKEFEDSCSSDEQKGSYARTKKFIL